MSARPNDIVGHVLAARAVGGAPAAAEAVATAALICVDLDAYYRQAWPLGPDSVVGAAVDRNLWRRALAFLALHMPAALAGVPYAQDALGRPSVPIADPAIADAPEHELDRIGRF